MICAVPVIIQTTRQWMWLYKNSPGGSLGIYTYESTTEYIISANINSTSNDMSQWLGHCCFVLFFYLATIKQKICWKTGILCAENCEWSDSMWPLERAAWTNSAALRRLHKVVQSLHIDSVCHRCVEKSLQRYMQQSHRSATEARAADTTRSLWMPKRCLKMWRTCINYNGKHLEQSFIQSLTSCMRREPVLGRSSFFNYTKVLFMQTNVVSLWKCLFCHPYLSPSVAFKFSWCMNPADFPKFPRIWVFFLLMDQIFFPFKNVHYPHAVLCFTCCFKMVIIGLQTSRWGRTKQCFFYLKETLWCSSG